MFHLTRSGSRLLGFVALWSIVCGAVSVALAGPAIDPDALAPAAPGRPLPHGFTPCEVVVTVGSGHAAPGGGGTVPLYLSNTVSLVSGQLDISDKPDLLAASGCESLVADVSCTASETSGDVTLQFSTAPGSEIGVVLGSGAPRFELAYDVAAGAPVGPVSLVPMNLSATSVDGEACQVVGFAGSFDVIPCGDGIVGPGEDCDDGNLTAGDCCAPDCLFEPSGSACDLGLFCDGPDACDGAGQCVAGPPPICDDGVACTADSCDEEADACAHAPVDAQCSDGLFCNGAETCNVSAGCQAGTSMTCDDGVECTADFCDEGQDSCVNEPADFLCDDGVFCNGVETCDATAGCQAGTAPECDDGLDCTDDVCDEAANICVNVLAQACDDGIDCTVDSCDPQTGACLSEPSDALCDDGSSCNGVETCDPVAGCLPGTGLDCDDDIACTVDSCSDEFGSCTHQEVDGVCQDGLYCNGVEQCVAATGCQPATAPPCSAAFCDETADTCIAAGAPLSSGVTLLLFAGLLVLVGSAVFGLYRP